METQKITPKPLVHSDRINKARDISGIRKRMRDSRIVGGALSFLGWFTIPAEVFLRRRFGYRWFTPLNFYAGVFLLIAVMFFQYLASMLLFIIGRFGGDLNPFHSDAVAPDYGGGYDMALILWIYIIMGLLHLIRRWWRNQGDVELHSYDDGISHLEFIGGLVMGVVNILSIPVLEIYMFLFPASRKEVTKRPKVINDRTAFTNTVIEPLAFFVLSFACGYMIERLWFYITAFAVAVSANMKETAKRTRVLDFKDSMLEAKAMAELRKGKSAEEKKSTAAKKDNKKPVPNRPTIYPDLNSIIDEVHRESRTVVLYDRG